MKKTAKVLAVVVLVLAAALAAHPLWVGPVVKVVVEKVGPKFTGTPIVLTGCDVNLYSGHIELAGLDLANPAGCSERTAAGVSVLKLDIDTLSALSDVVNVRSAEVSGIFASYVKGASGKYNFTEIADNVTAATGDGKPSGQTAVKKAAGEDAPAKKVVIERLSVGDVRVAAFGMKVTLLPGTIVLTDVGKKSNGATLGEVWEQASAQVMQSSGAAGKQLSAAWELSAKYGQQGLELGQKGLDAGTEGVKKALDSVKKMDTKGATEALKDAGKSLESVGKDLKNLFKK